MADTTSHRRGTHRTRRVVNITPATANPTFREIGTAAAFHMPPNPRNAPNVPTSFSGRPRNAEVPAEVGGAITLGTSHGRRHRVPKTATNRRRQAETRATMSATKPPVGVRLHTHTVATCQAGRVRHATTAGSNHATIATDHWP